MIAKGMIDIMSIIKKPAVKRNHEEMTQLAYFLQYRVEFFRGEDTVGHEFVMALAERMECKTYKKHDVLMRMGDVGDRMYISVQGHLGIWLSPYPNLKNDKPVGTKHEFEAVGELALTNDHDRRKATVACIDDG